jgi:hypothetical protein
LPRARLRTEKFGLGDVSAGIEPGNRARDGPLARCNWFCCAQRTHRQQAEGDRAIALVPATGNSVLARSSSERSIRLRCLPCLLCACVPARYFVNDAVQSVDPGETAGYNFGFGFAVNEDISLSAQITGSYQSNARASGKDIFGSSREPVSLRSALTYRCSPKIYLEPSVTIGLDGRDRRFCPRHFADAPIRQIGEIG